MERGLTQQQAGNSFALGISDASGMTMAFNGATGQDAYTGRDLSRNERIFQGALGVIGVVGTATGATGLLKASISVSGSAASEFSAAGGGLRGLTQTGRAGLRGLRQSAAAEWSGTAGELTQLRPFAQTRLGQGLAGTRTGNALGAADDLLQRSGAARGFGQGVADTFGSVFQAGRAAANTVTEGFESAASSLRSLRSSRQSQEAIDSVNSVGRPVNENIGNTSLLNDG